MWLYRIWKYNIPLARIRPDIGSRFSFFVSWKLMIWLYQMAMTKPSESSSTHSHTYLLSIPQNIYTPFKSSYLKTHSLTNATSSSNTSYPTPFVLIYPLILVVIKLCILPRPILFLILFFLNTIDPSKLWIFFMPKNLLKF